MAERDTAQSRLDRILYLLPMAAREGGVALAHVAETLNTTPSRVLQDLEEVTARVYYHPSGGADDLQILVEPDRVSLRTTGEFKRPTKLTPREALALVLGLRVLAAESEEPRRGELLELAGRLDRELATAPAEAFLCHYALEGYGGAGSGVPNDDAVIRGILIDACDGGRRCRISYVKAEATEPEDRMLDPYAVVYSRGYWYVIGAADAGASGPADGGVSDGADGSLEAGDAGAIRVFRLDRVLAIEGLEETFERPTDFDPADYVTEGRVYRADEDEVVVIRYSPEIGRWLLERGEGVEQTDGSVIAERRASDPRWAVCHVLQYGPDAEILEPPSLRTLARRTANEVVQLHAS